MGIMNKIINTLIRPKVAAESISKEPFIEEAVMIVGIYALFSAMAAYVQSTKMVIVTEGSSLINPELAGTIGIISAIVLAFITWLILSGIINTISLVVGGKGRFYPETMVLVGFSMLPLIIGSAVSAMIISTAETSTVTISLADPSSTQAVLREIQNRTPFLVASIVNSIAWIWSSGIVYIGLQKIQKLSKEMALVVVAIPLVFMLLITYGMR